MKRIIRHPDNIAYGNSVLCFKVNSTDPGVPEIYFHRKKDAYKLIKKLKSAGYEGKISSVYIFPDFNTFTWGG